MEEIMNVALIGFGLAGKTFHAPLIEAVNELKLCKILSSRKDEIENLYPNVEVISDFEQALEEDIDLIVIATPNHLHFEQAKRAILAGKNVVIDKPMTPTLSQAYQLVQLAHEQDVTLSVFHNRRFDGDFLTIKELIQSDALGRITYFESNFNRFRPEVNKENWRETTDQAGGVFFDLAPHLIDQAVDLFGPPLKIFADMAKLRDQAQNDDYFHLIFEYERCRIHLNASTVCRNPGDRFVIHGLKGSFTKWGLDPQEKNLKHGMSGESSDLGEDSEENYGTLMTDKTSKIPTINGDYKKYYQDIKQISSGQAILVMEVMEACLKSYDLKKWISIS